MQRFTLSKFYRPENVVERAVSRVKECGGSLDRIRFPEPTDESGVIWVTFVDHGMPRAFRISKGPMGPYRVFDVPSSPLFYDEKVAGFMVDTLRSLPDKKALEYADKEKFEAICAWLHRDPAELLNELNK